MPHEAGRLHLLQTAVSDGSCAVHELALVLSSPPGAWREAKLKHIRDMFYLAASRVDWALRKDETAEPF